MTILDFTLIVLAISFCAGMIGSLTGLGGGIIIIPCMVIFLKVDIHYAMGAGLFAVMATSAGATLAYMRQGFTNIRIGIFLEVAAVSGAVIGAYTVAFLPTHLIELLFGILLIVMSYLNWKRDETLHPAITAHPLANKLKLNGQQPSKDGPQNYLVQNVWSGFSLMGLAGILSGLLGIGSGTVKVMAMDQAMQLPYKVSTSTSNFMIGLTAGAGAGVFLKNGYINAVIIFPVVIGVYIGALMGAKCMLYIPVKPLRILFSCVILILAVQMIYSGANL